MKVLRRALGEGAFIVAAALAGYAAWTLQDPVELPVVVLATPQTDGWDGKGEGAVSSTDAATRTWFARLPWGSPPVLPEPPPPPPPPPPVPIAIFAKRSGYEVVFMAPGGMESFVKPGQRLAEGGRLIGIEKLDVVWVDRDGVRQRRQMLQTILPPAPQQ